MPYTATMMEVLEAAVDLQLPAHPYEGQSRPSGQTAEPPPSPPKTPDSFKDVLALFATSPLPSLPSVSGSPHPSLSTMMTPTPMTSPVQPSTPPRTPQLQSSPTPMATSPKPTSLLSKRKIEVITLSDDDDDDDVEAPPPKKAKLDSSFVDE